MKTIQIKVTIDGVSYFSEKMSFIIDDDRVSDFRIRKMSEKGKQIWDLYNQKEEQVFIGSKLLKKSIITIIEL